MEMGGRLERLQGRDPAAFSSALVGAGGAIAYLALWGARPGPTPCSRSWAWHPWSASSAGDRVGSGPG